MSECVCMCECEKKCEGMCKDGCAKVIKVGMFVLCATCTVHNLSISTYDCSCIS